MHFRHALITFSRLGRRSIHSTPNPCLLRDPLSTLVDHGTTSMPSSPDDTAPLKTRSRRTKAHPIVQDTEASVSPVDSDTAPPKRRGRPKKVIDASDDTSEQTSSEPPKKRTRKPKTPNEDHLAISHGSQHHASLAEFLSYADTANLSPTSTVYRGTLYEYTVLDALKRLAFSLTRVGRASDLGIDLLGTWSIPSRPRPLNVLIQCKAEAPKPSMIRELEGAVVGAPVRYRGEGTMAVLAAAKEATKGVRDALGRSRLPMAYLNVTTEGRVRQFVWNHAAVECGLEGLGVALRYLANGESEVALTWKGMPWSPSSPKPRPAE
ncbi:hypothetical protein E4T48_07229 [Aureobasidium sp. EXF-10727]|nr:hypothetical protein E4T48_07229 [Aureobasidium sp. EXF-10727]KAI4724950.1 hypothetical protein E4T49_07279 [Aureobasidium sp. EXF-10728]